jgi:hypothetical protein
MMRMRSMGLAGMLFLAACGGPTQRTLDPASNFYSFETGMEGWEARGLDLALGAGEIAWSIALDVTLASDSRTSLKVYLANYNDAGKIFVQRTFNLFPNTKYDVAIRFDLASSDFGEVNLFRIIAGGFPRPPVSPQDLRPAFRDSTGNGRSTSGYVWLSKIYRDVLQTDSSGRAVIVVGIWGTWEGPDTYYLDALEIEFAPSS